MADLVLIFFDFKASRLFHVDSSSSSPLRNELELLDYVNRGESHNFGESLLYNQYIFFGYSLLPQDKP